jgi:fatty-acid desaturase
MPVQVLEEEPIATTPSASTPTTPLIEAFPRATANAHTPLPVAGREPKTKKMNWTTTLFMAAFHVGAIAALFMFSWTALIVSVVLYVIAINVGIGMCYHRLLTHRGYRTPKWVEYCLAVCGTLALEGGPIFWVSTPNDGTWWAHAGWIMHGESLHQDVERANRYAPDLAKDRFHVLLSKYHYVPMIVLGLILLAVGGWPMVMWGIFLRTTLGLHSTWLVNSATHLWGSRRFETRDDSRNNWWVALLTGGEGWHNNHHAHPVSARHGLKWYEFDPNYYGIWILKHIGLAKDIKIAQYDAANPRPAGAA